MLWLYLVLTATIIWAIVNVLDKWIISDHIKMPTAIMFLNAIVGLLFSFLLLFFVKIDFISIEIALWTFLLSMLSFLAIFLYYKSLKMGEVSKMALALRVGPIFVLLMALVFLSEKLTAYQLIGFFVILCGAMLVSIERSGKFFLNRGFAIMIVATFLFAVFDIVLKLLLLKTDYFTIFFWYNVFYFLITMFFFFANFKKIAEGIISNKKILPVAFANGFISSFAYLLFSVAVFLGNISLVSVISATQQAFVFLIATGLSLFMPHILREELTRKNIALKLASIIIIFAGTLLLF